jgi:hypothetical protein
MKETRNANKIFERNILGNGYLENRENWRIQLRFFGSVVDGTGSG